MTVPRTLTDVTTTGQFDTLALATRESDIYEGDPADYGLSLVTVHIPTNQVVEHRFKHTNVGAEGNFGTAALLWLAMFTSSSKGLVENEIDRERLAELALTFASYRAQIDEEHPHLNIAAFYKIYAKVEQTPRQGSEYRYGVVYARTSSFEVQMTNVAQVYLGLYLLSECKKEVNSINFDGAFGIMPNVIWTPQGPIVSQDAWDVFDADFGAPLALDKWPRLLDHVLPKNVRITNAAVRLGARLDPKTVVMPAGFVNFNAGTSGILDPEDPSGERMGVMIEGRTSQGVIFYDGSDCGGGGSSMGVLSGGGTERVSLGYRSLLGANAGSGIAIGKDCVIEAGLYLTAGTKVFDVQTGRTVNAIELSGKPNLEFIRHSQIGAVMARFTEGNKPLNKALHA